MKKIYNAPEASLLCFRAVEDLAIEFDQLVHLENLTDKTGKPADDSTQDIMIPIG